MHDARSYSIEQSSDRNDSNSNTMTDPLQDIENTKAQTDMGIMYVRIWYGAYCEALVLYNDNADRAAEVANHTLTCFVRGMFADNRDAKNEEGGDNT